MGFGKGFGLRSLEGRFWPSVTSFEHVRDIKKKPGACIYSRVGIMSSSVANEMPDLMISTHAARPSPRHPSLLHNHLRKQSLRSNARIRLISPCLVTSRRVDFGPLHLEPLTGSRTIRRRLSVLLFTRTNEEHHVVHLAFAFQTFPSFVSRLLCSTGRRRSARTFSPLQYQTPIPTPTIAIAPFYY